MSEPKEPVIALSPRGVKWLGALLFLFSMSVIAILVTYVPPIPAMLILLFVFVFLGMSGLGMALTTWVLERRGSRSLDIAFFLGAVTGASAVTLLLLQYFQVLDWVTVLMVVVFALASIGVYLQTHKPPAERAPGKRPARKKRVQKASGKKKKDDNTLAAHAPRRRTRVRKPKP